jgi:hypothetical protein
VTSRVEYCSISSRGLPCATIPGLVHDHEPVAELLGLVHVMGRQDERDTSLLEPVEAIPQQVPRLRIQPGRRLVEEEHRRFVDQRPGNRQAPLHPARQRLDLVVGAFGQLRELEQLVGPAVDLRPLEPEVATVDHEVLADGQLGVKGVLLRHDAEAGADVGPVGRGVHPHHPEVTRADRRDTADHPHRRGLAGPVRAEEAERFARGDVEVDVVDGDELAEALRQAAGRDQGGFVALRPRC